MPSILLTGAGFSHNWGGWLASEAFEYLLGRPEVDATLRLQLWRSKTVGGGFEDTLAELQEEFRRRQTAEAEKPLRNLESALSSMFGDMDQAFAHTTFEPQNFRPYMVRTFLVKFDAIFTLNQDLLLERHYLDGNIELSDGRRWGGWQIPGVKLVNPNPPEFDPLERKVALRTPDPSRFKEEGRSQPYYKLHGSSNWISDTGQRMLVMGGKKAAEINQHPLLCWYHDKFAEYLLRPNARLMVIGYSFSDDHINEIIMRAADKNGLKLFIVDPRGVDVLDKLAPNAMIRAPSLLMSKLNPHIVGASRRPLRATFGNDRVEHAKLMQFFAGGQ